ncbi:MAG TPA: hypothetical protein VEG60_02825 [Candidatus Binatia bacterium]|nr:hypothetical protein [Candidatus Binatia bacterium]
MAQIEFTEWTPDGHLRHSRFVGLMEDKEARRLYGGLNHILLGLFLRSLIASRFWG